MKTAWLSACPVPVRPQGVALLRQEPEALPIRQKITPNLWFDDNAEEAVRFYISTFADSRIVGISRYNEAGPGPAGTVMAISFELEGQPFAAINGGPVFKLTEAVSFFVDCDTQEEIDRLWTRLGEGGQEQPCGWLKDRFGLSWQINSRLLIDMLQDSDPKQAARVMQEMLQMRKIDLERLRRAYAG